MQNNKQAKAKAKVAASNGHETAALTAMESLMSRWIWGLRLRGGLRGSVEGPEIDNHLYDYDCDCDCDEEIVYDLVMHKWASCSVVQCMCGHVLCVQICVYINGSDIIVLV